MSKSFTPVIFLNTKSEYDVIRFNTILSPSIKFLSHKVLVIPEMVETLQLDDSYRIIYDCDIIKTSASYPNYRKQCLLKLYVANHIDTTHYLILDSDIYVNKPFFWDEFFNANGQITLFVYDADGYLDKTKMDTCCHTKWIFDALSVYNKTLDDISRPLYYGVTPGLLITEQVKQILKFFGEYHPNFVEFYGEFYMGCEYSYYYLHVNRKNLYVADYSKQWISGVWTDKNSLDDLNPHTNFWIIQSTRQYDNKFLLNFLKNRG